LQPQQQRIALAGNSCGTEKSKDFSCLPQEWFGKDFRKARIVPVYFKKAVCMFTSLKQFYRFHEETMRQPADHSVILAESNAVTERNMYESILFS
jgi:hypothetical protein